jgi:hypothetical protein
VSREWDTYVYRTDLEELKFRGFFENETSAKKWIPTQEGTYEISDEPPSKRIPKEENDDIGPVPDPGGELDDPAPESGEVPDDAA